jgi:transcriptional regulator GlxA family with amidase domain
MKQLRVAVLIEEGFVPTELALVKEVLRIADRLGSDARISCQICTTGGKDLVEGMGDVLVRADPFRQDDAALPDHLIVLGGSGIRARFDAVKAHLRWIDRMGCCVILMSDAAAEWRRHFPERERLTTHWETHQTDCDADNGQVATIPLYSRIGRFTTAGGMTSAADVVLTTVIAPLSTRLAEAVANVMLLARIRDGSECQPRSVHATSVGNQCKVRQAIAAMEANLEEPLAVADLAAAADLSVRQFERKFKALLGAPPNAFYRSLRLRRARTLLEQTALSIGEIAMACGFGTASSFSKSYADAFGDLPSRRRTQPMARLAPGNSTPKLQGTCHAPVPFSARAACPSAHPA